MIHETNRYYYSRWRWLMVRLELLSTHLNKDVGAANQRDDD